MYSDVFHFSSLHLLTDTVRGVVHACARNNTKQKRDQGEIILLVILQQFLVEEQVCLRVEYP